MRRRYRLAMVMSHAAAIWIPSTGHDVDALAAILERHNVEDQLQHVIYQRSTPDVTCIVAPLDGRPDAQMDFDLLNDAAADISKQLRTRTYALYAFFGSGDWLQVTAFARTGNVRWTEAMEEGAPTEKMRATGEALGLRVQGAGRTKGTKLKRPVITQLTFPYWRMISESKPPVADDVLGLGMKPTFDLDSVEGWEFLGEVHAGDERDQDEWSVDAEAAEPEATGPVLTSLKVGDRVVDGGEAEEVVAIETLDGERVFRLESVLYGPGMVRWIGVDEVGDYELRRLKE